MKTLKLIVAAIILLAASSTQAQVSVNINIGTPPQWGPVGYSEVEYYYLPDIEAYYDIRTTQFIYFGEGRWIRSNYLPRQYRNYDLYGGYKVVLNDYHGSKPYSYYRKHKAKYYKGYRNGPQRTIGRRYDKHDRHDDDRYDDRDHYNNHDDHDDHYENGNGHGHGHGNKHGHGNGKH